MNTFSESEIIQFLETMAKKGSIPINTAMAQKAAVSKVLSVYSDDEKNQLHENIDMDDLTNRFQNLAKHDLTPQSLRVYISRFKTAFTGYIQWNTNPSDYKPKSKKGRPKQKPNPTIEKDNQFIKASYAFAKANPDNKEPTENPDLNSMLIFPIVTESSDGYIKLPRFLSAADIERIIPFVTATIKSLYHDKKRIDSLKNVNEDN